MNPYPPITNVRSHLGDKFSSLRLHATWHRIWANLTGKNNRLAVFPEEAPEKSPNRRYLGITEIPLDGIRGTLNRQHDFDQEFRPLKSYLRDRWVNAYLAFENGGWPPILVHQVGETYYVEDGHHRVSVARFLGLAYLPAKVWEYPRTGKEIQRERPLPCPQGQTVRTYVRAIK